MSEVLALERWLSERELAAQLGVSERWLRYRRDEYKDSTDPMPSGKIAGHRRYKQSKVEGWLVKHGLLELEGAA